MYHLFKVSTIRWVLAAVWVICFGVLYLLFMPEGLLETFKVISTAALCMVIIFIVIGQTFVFDWLVFVLGRLLKIPNITGEWSGHVSSNWPLVGDSPQERNYEVNGIALLRKPCCVKIKSRLFTIEVIYSSDDKYTDSTTIISKPVRQAAGCVRLFFMYEGHTPVPKKNDSSKHYGGAYLDIERNTKKTLEGRYWTDRNWHNGLNTAGIMELSKDK